MSDPVLGPVRTLRQHLIVAQTINGASQSWPGAPKVSATSSGWLVAGPTGATVAVSTVQALWSTVLRGRPGLQRQDLRAAGDLGAGELEAGELGAGEPDPGELARRVMNLGHEMAQGSATETDT
ncbi:hypothetical protein [Arthrobacter sp. NicSoilC12]|uniref:hypothetical protein n=1 Tax=Arthrobacter sp. NicSoilC12 TaxID=2831001 RepID=UPI001CC7289B|nr:hypothetical protein [Arthrobacter sp. NicSoilC12]